ESCVSALRAVISDLSPRNSTRVVPREVPMPGRAVALSLLVLVCACAVRSAEPPGGAVGPAPGAAPTRAAGAAAHGQRAAIADGGTFVRPADPPSARRPRPLRRVRPV